MHFKPLDIASIAIFSAIWAVLNLTLGRLGFTLFQLPIFCDLSVYLSLLLATWVSGKTGTPSAVGVIGAMIVLTIQPSSTQMIGFLTSAIIFDALMIFCKHRISIKPYNMAVATIATMISAYFAGVVIGTVFMGRSLEWALTFWGVWHLIGGIIGLIIAIPVIGALEKAKAKEVKA
ncbi:hypothetical protein KEJ45_00560 [Candidatus Bathyarchaeota archaeon]|nr:hypothetical protein [Candidatus Bathyarchaeota archaeon]